MKTYIAGVITGIIVATVGVSGIFKIIDKSIDIIKTTSHEISK